jgi:hypothetical protein
MYNLETVYFIDIWFIIKNEINTFVFTLIIHTIVYRHIVPTFSRHFTNCAFLSYFFIYQLRSF